MIFLAAFLAAFVATRDVGPQYQSVWRDATGFEIVWGASETLYQGALRELELSPPARAGTHTRCLLASPEGQLIGAFSVSVEDYSVDSAFVCDSLSARESVAGFVEQVVVPTSGMLLGMRREGQAGPMLFLESLPGDLVRSHLNLGVKLRSFGRRTFSVKPPRGSSATVGHVDGLELSGVQLVVQAGGNRRVRSGGSKTVHAWVAGRLVRSSPPRSDIVEASVPLRYNPHDGMTSFMRQAEDGSWSIPVYTARRATLVADPTGWRVSVDDPS